MTNITKKFINDNYRLNNANNLIVWVDGCYEQSLSTNNTENKNIIVCSLGDAKSKFTHLLTTDACFSPEINDGYFIYLSENLRQTTIIQLLFLSTKNDSRARKFCNLIVDKSKAGSYFIEEFATINNEIQYRNQVNTRIVAHAFQASHYIKLQNESRRAEHFANIEIAQYQQSSVNFHLLDFGGKKLPTTINQNFLEQQASFQGNILFFLTEQQEHNFKLQLTHNTSHCQSNVLAKGLLKDQARSNFAGRITVVPNAEKSEAHLTNKNILLADTATIQTSPELEIYTDDVKCSHGAAVGQLNPKALFYLLSRGIPENKAKELLLQGFTQEIFDRFPKFLQKKIIFYYQQKHL